MRFFKRFFKWLLAIITIVLLFLYFSEYNYLLKAVKTIYFNGHTTAFLSDYTVFDNREIAKSEYPTPWPEHNEYDRSKATSTLKELHSEYKTTAFLVIKNDSIWHEQYFEDFDKSTKSNSFSMAKTMVSAMLGKAIMQGHIKSLDQPVGDFIPEFNDGLSKKLTVGDLASMSSGLNWDEAYYNPFSITTRAYFDDNLENVMLNLKVIQEPGQRYKYLSGNTQLLGMVIERATGEKLADYLSKEFWQPLGTENSALWQLDSEENGLEKAYCCIASNARDFARFGKLYKDLGEWKGKQLLNKDFVSKSIRPRFDKQGWMYGYGVWLLPYQNKNFFIMRGHLGQYIIVEPTDNLIIVRLGHLKGRPISLENPYSKDLYGYIDETYKMLANVKQS